MKKRMAKWITWYMVLAMVVIGITPRVDAGLVTSELINPSSPDRISDLKKIQKVLESKMISERLKEYGFTDESIQKRLSELNDEQIHQMASKVDDLRVGGDALGVIIAFLVIAILVIILLYLLGHRVAVK